jgi:OHCU decarboxylase
MTLDELNRMAAQSAADALKLCCGSQRWAEGMTACRPFLDVADLHRAADVTSNILGREDWLEAFQSHPKIGETKNVSGWSEKEQEGMTAAAEDVRNRLAQLNRAYQDRFGFIFIICAAGKSGEEMLALLEERIQNRRQHEMRIASAEQVKIVHLRLNKLINS